MLRRSPTSATSLHRKQEELSRRESELRDEVAKLERLIADAPRLAEETSRRQREEVVRGGGGGGGRRGGAGGSEETREGVRRLRTALRVRPTVQSRAVCRVHCV